MDNILCGIASSSFFLQIGSSKFMVHFHES